MLRIDLARRCHSHGVCCLSEPNIPDLRTPWLRPQTAAIAPAQDQVSMAVSAVHFPDTHVPAYTTDAMTATVMMPMRIVYSSMVTPSSSRLKRSKNPVSVAWSSPSQSRLRRTLCAERCKSRPAERGCQLTVSPRTGGCASPVASNLADERRGQSRSVFLSTSTALVRLKEPSRVARRAHCAGKRARRPAGRPRIRPGAHRGQ